jgi:hypothetical protein
LSPGSCIQFCKICALAGFVFGSMRFVLLAAMECNLKALRGVIFPLSFRYLLHYLMGHKEEIGIASVSAIAALLSAIVFLVVFGRLYLGMHTPIDVAAGLVLGALLLLGWCMVDDYVDAFITTGENGGLTL